MTSFSANGMSALSRFSSRVGVIAAVLIPLACEHGRMLPASAARVVSGAEGFAVVEQDGVRGAGAVHPYFAFESFFVRPAYGDMYPSLPPWPTRMRGDDELSRAQYKLWSDDLPTREMQRLSLPEGVLADGGEMTGFLFFENATRRESQVHFDAEFKNGRGDHTVTSISIPFRVE